MLRSYADEYAESIAETLCFQGFEAEVAGLPGRYAPPTGCLLLAMQGDRPAGCVAMRDLGGGTCEMKRLYVAPEFRGQGVGRLLVEDVLGKAERTGYRRMVLDTVPEMAEAIALYRRFGFVDTEPYWQSPVEQDGLPREGPREPLTSVPGRNHSPRSTQRAIASGAGE